jgi:hypothetical protein
MPKFSMGCKFKKTSGHAFPARGFIAPFSDSTVSYYPPLSLWTAFRKAAYRPLGCLGRLVVIGPSGVSLVRWSQGLTLHGEVKQEL